MYVHRSDLVESGKYLPLQPFGALVCFCDCNIRKHQAGEGDVYLASLSADHQLPETVRSPVGIHNLLDHLPNLFNKARVGSGGTLGAGRFDVAYDLLD